MAIHDYKADSAYNRETPPPIALPVPRDWGFLRRPLAQPGGLPILPLHPSNHIQ
jgi:hypothetical protein